MRTGARPQHVPKAEEISVAIRGAIGETNGGSPPSATEVRAFVEKEHPDWKISEKRVAKLLKKALKGGGPTIDDETCSMASEGIASFAGPEAVKRRKSALSKAGSSLRKLITAPMKKGDHRRRHHAVDPAAPPPQLTLESPAVAPANNGLSDCPPKRPALTESGATNLIPPPAQSYDEEKVPMPVPAPEQPLERPSTVPEEASKEEGVGEQDAPTAETEEMAELDEGAKGTDEAKEEEDLGVVEEAAEAEAAIAAEKETKVVERFAPYDDDNDGKKASGCCEGSVCVIL